MFVYFNVTTTAATTQSRIVPVTCEKCGCSFFYEMTRMGEGVKVAHYGIDLSSAPSAERKAETDARNRLSTDAELVPCPTCRWINDDVICWYRKARFREWTLLAGLVASVGIVATLIWASVIYLGERPENRGTIPYFLLPGILGGAIAGAILFLQNWFRNRIQPNLFHPEEPTLPLGTPPALVLNGDDELVLARPNDSQRDLADDSCTMVFQIGKHAYDTDLCCVCLQQADPVSSRLAKPSEKSSLPTPLCAACARKRTILRWARSLGVALIVFAFGMLLAFVAMVKEEGVLFIILVLSGICGLATGLLYKGPIQVTAFDSLRGLLYLKFANPEFRSLVYERVVEKPETPDFSFLQDPEES